jgi:hypothetical protein
VKGNGIYKVKGQRIKQQRVSTGFFSEKKLNLKANQQTYTVYVRKATKSHVQSQKKHHLLGLALVCINAG